MKTALVTGGSRGIGLAIALELGRSGYAVAIMATKPESAYPQSTQKLREAGVSYSWHAGDIANTEDRLRVVDEVAALLEGNTCGRRTTSCADQLVRALRSAQAAE